MHTLLRPSGTETLEVLVVDSDPATVAVLHASLGDLARLHHVANAYQALYELRTQRIDVVVTELFLPGASGVDLLRRMRANGVDVPAIVLTQASGPHPELDAFGVRHLLHKPVSADLLRAALTDLLPASAKTEPTIRTVVNAA